MPQRLTASQYIAQDLQQKIMSRQYAAGERLPTERSLAALYKVSRIPVREALKTLAQQGLVEIRHGSGNYVKFIDRNNVTEQICRYIYMSGSADHDVLQLWQIMQAESAKQAARHRTERDMEELRALHASFPSPEEPLSPKFWKDFFETDKNFHLALARLGDNKLICGCTEMFYGAMHFDSSNLYRFADNAISIMATHASMLKALELQDEAAAAKAIDAEFEIGNRIFYAALHETAPTRTQDNDYINFTRPRLENPPPNE